MGRVSIVRQKSLAPHTHTQPPFRFVLYNMYFFLISSSFLIARQRSKHPLVHTTYARMKPNICTCPSCVCVHLLYMFPTGLSLSRVWYSSSPLYVPPSIYLSLSLSQSLSRTVRTHCTPDVYVVPWDPLASYCCAITTHSRRILICTCHALVMHGIEPYIQEYVRTYMQCIVNRGKYVTG